MESLLVAVVSEDREYNKRLAEALVSVCRDLSVRAFSSRSFVKEWSEYCGRGMFCDTFDIILWAGNEISELYSDNIVFLADKVSMTGKDYEANRFAIYRYNAVSVIAADIFDIYAHLTGRSAFFTKEKNIRIYGFASAGGGTGCTSIAMAVSQELSRFYGKRVLYISFEDVESVCSFMRGDNEKKDIGEFLYRLLGKMGEKTGCRKDRMPFLDSYVMRDAFGVEAFVPAKGKNPLRELTAEDSNSFFAALVNCGRYDAMIFDFSSCVTEAALHAMSLTEKICLVVRKETVDFREKKYMNQLGYCGGKDITSKIVRIQNLALSREIEAKSQRDTARDTKDPNMGVCIIESDAVDKGSKGLPLEGDFGNSINKLTEMLTDVI